ncbi:phosphate-starvation-inducible PsiE family protein [Thalassotalea marina]|uniref:Phosphate-starvation-inducible E-like protein n=1 Tax=Thalassotalea marina TaxID=1673741 RepID=A0A919EJJ0_9GAMM|nr:phosphate-starvation-inducible PsiE family protein [Thalassotalea marina]GHF91510.1 hypothetical protein GCM10017161_19210 [Thalassotalea marina]
MYDSDNKLIARLQSTIYVSVKVLAVLMTFVIFMGVVDVAWTIYQKLGNKPLFILTVNDMLATFGSFMAVLIAIEIFVNITIYLKEEIIHVKIVIATALMAVSRKVIILDLKVVTAEQIYGLGILIVALSIGYWVVLQLPSVKINKPNEPAKLTNPLKQQSEQKADQ